MRRGLIRIALLSVAVALVVAPAALAGTGDATYQKIYKDLVDNGRLDGHYTAAQVAAAMKDPTVQGYGQPSATSGGLSGTKVVKTPTGGVAGVQKTIGQVAPAQASGTLPFTGAQLGIFAIIGLALVSGGLLLRSTARERSDH
jgi:hypothetical protein